MVEVRDGKDRAGGDSMWGNRAEETGVEGRGLGRTGLAFQAWKVAMSQLERCGVCSEVPEVALPRVLGCQQSLQVIFPNM